MFIIIPLLQACLDELERLMKRDESVYNVPGRQFNDHPLLWSGLTSFHFLFLAFVNEHKRAEINSQIKKNKF